MPTQPDDTPLSPSVRRCAGLQVRRVYDAPLPTDGTRVLVDRLWPRGVSKERAALDLWLKDIAPSTELRQWFAHDPARWTGFCQRYRAELDANPACVEQLGSLARKGPLTLLFGARNTEQNEAVVLAAYLRERSTRQNRTNRET